MRVVHASEVVEMDDKPASALRKKRDTSIARAAELVHEGKADALVSLGNTGGIFAAATFKVGRIPGVDRGCIATVIPRQGNEFVLLDAGANIECKPLHLAQFAVMGSIYSREVLRRKNPRVGILSIGTEDSKGNELTLEAFKLCQRLDLNFIGNVEGHDLFKDHVDVVVCDGFVGNIVLKTSESLAVAMFSMLKRELMHNRPSGRSARFSRRARFTPSAGGWTRRCMAARRCSASTDWCSRRTVRRANAPSPARCASPPRPCSITSTRSSPAKSRARMKNWTPQQISSPRFRMSPKFKNPRARFNFQGRTCSITGVGSYVPAKILTNADLEKMVDTSDEWITTRTGIKERRMAAKDEFTSDMAAKAAQRAMKMAGVTAEQTRPRSSSPPSRRTCRFPPRPAWCSRKSARGARRRLIWRRPAPVSFTAWKSASNSSCRAPTTRCSSSARKNFRPSSNWKDRNTCVLFGDGAGAAVLQNRPNAHGLLTAVMGADGGKANLLFMPGGGSRCPATAGFGGRDDCITCGWKGEETFKNAVQAMCTAAQEALRRCELDISKIKCIIPHQANRRIIDAVGERLGATPEQMFINVNRYGNTSAASVAIALDEAVASGKIQRGDLILLIVFGAGLTWGAAVIEW